MFFFAYVLEGLAVVVNIGLTLYYWLLFIRVLISWVSPNPFNPIVTFLRNVTDPVLLPFRNLLMPLTMRIRVDLSPIIVFMLIAYFKNTLVGFLLQLAFSLK